MDGVQVHRLITWPNPNVVCATYIASFNISIYNSNQRDWKTLNFIILGKGGSNLRFVKLPNYQYCDPKPLISCNKAHEVVCIQQKKHLHTDVNIK
jgi:hypothetical protein